MQDILNNMLFRDLFSLAFRAQNAVRYHLQVRSTSLQKFNVNNEKNDYEI